MKKSIVFISPTYNASFHLSELYESLREQSNKNWSWVIEKKFALKGIVDYLQSNYASTHADTIVAIVDGDDALCNENTVDLVLKEYNDNQELEVLWTAHSWDINGMNISRDMPGNINPYQYPWVSSHLKTFKLGVLQMISNENFKDLDGNWFERGYDQAIYLPLLHLAKSRKFLNEICYLYRINSNSLKVRDWKEKSQMDTIRLVRARGYVA